VARADIDEWHPPSEARMPDGPDSFPASGTNSLASIGSRWLARLIDLLVVGVPYVAVASVVVLIATSGDSAGDDATAAADPRAQVLFWGPPLALAVLYETICVTLWGQTLGKLALGVRVARVANGRCPLWWESAIRIALPSVVAVVPHPLAKVVSIVLYAVAMFDPLRRSIPDRAAGTVVVRAR